LNFAQREYAVEILKDLANSHYKNYVMDRLANMLSDDNSDVRESAADALGSLGKADERVIETLAELLSDDNSSVRGRAAYALGRVGIPHETVLDALKNICEYYKEYDDSVSDPEGGYMKIYDWAFRTLWQHPPSRIEEKGD